MDMTANTTSNQGTSTAVPLFAKETAKNCPLCVPTLIGVKHLYEDCTSTTGSYFPLG